MNFAAVPLENEDSERARQEFIGGLANLASATSPDNPWQRQQVARYREPFSEAPPK